jgi:hypothetical protein
VFYCVFGEFVVRQLGLCGRSACSWGDLNSEMLMKSKLGGVIDAYKEIKLARMRKRVI